MKLKQIFLVTFLIIFSLQFFVFAEEQISITTYYPSPYGSYNRLQADKLGVGDNNGDGSLASSDLPSASGNAWVKGNLGISTTDTSDYGLTIADGSALIKNSAGDPAYYFYDKDSLLTNKYWGVGFSGGRLSFFNDNDGSYPWSIEHLVIDGSNGNVGIGTTSPAAKLDVYKNDDPDRIVRAQLGVCNNSTTDFTGCSGVKKDCQFSFNTCVNCCGGFWEFVTPKLGRCLDLFGELQRTNNATCETCAVTGTSQCNINCCEAKVCQNVVSSFVAVRGETSGAGSNDWAGYFDGKFETNGNFTTDGNVNADLLNVNSDISASAVTASSSITLNGELKYSLSNKLVCRRVTVISTDASATASCDSNEFVTGGGCYWENVNYNDVNDNLTGHPCFNSGCSDLSNQSTQGKGWYCNSSKGGDYTAYAMCCKME
jgi:hypothetical protein